MSGAAAGGRNRAKVRRREPLVKLTTELVALSPDYFAADRWQVTYPKPELIGTLEVAAGESAAFNREVYNLDRARH